MRGGAGDGFRPGPNQFRQFINDANRPASEDAEGELSRAASKTIASMATALWRVKRKLEEVPAEHLPDNLRHLPRHVRAAWDTMTAEGVEVIDPTGKKYKVGMAVKPIAFQPTPGVAVDMIHETVSPSVLYRGKTIQSADVIVACPPSEELRTPENNDGGTSHGA